MPCTPRPSATLPLVMQVRSLRQKNESLESQLRSTEAGSHAAGPPAGSPHTAVGSLGTQRGRRCEGSCGAARSRGDTWRPTFHRPLAIRPSVAQQRRSVPNVRAWRLTPIVRGALSIDAHLDRCQCWSCGHRRASEPLQTGPLGGFGLVARQVQAFLGELAVCPPPPAPQSAQGFTCQRLAVPRQGGRPRSKCRPCPFLWSLRSLIPSSWKLKLADESRRETAVEEFLSWVGHRRK